MVTATLYTEQQQCGVANLPAFGDTQDDRDSLGRPPADRLQAIVPAYTFNCTGRVAEWRACVEPGGDRERYYIQFQVWRPTAVPGCYTRVGYNAPPEPTFDDMGEVNNTDQLLQPGERDSPLHRCVLLPVSEDEQIQFQPDYVIGYYVDWFRDPNDDEDDGGVQVVSDQNVVIFNRIDVPLDDLKTQYAIPALGPDPSSCGFELEGSDSNLFQMTSSITGTPIISLNLTVITPTSSLSSSTSTLSGRSADFSPSPSPSVSVEDGGSGPNLLVVVAILLVILIIAIGM